MARRRKASSGKPQHPKGLPASAMSSKAAQHPTSRTPSVPAVPSVVTLQTVLSASSGIEVAHDELAAAVNAAREDGHTWSAIGQTLGTSAQSAHKRFAQVDQ